MLEIGIRAMSDAPKKLKVNRFISNLNYERKYDVKVKQQNGSLSLTLFTKTVALECRSFEAKSN